MRLQAMKLSGFKSFVDLTHIVLKGNIIAVVGPNGCGKSNIIDAIKWVLGESRQSSLRSQSMQDLIFSGSANRKPVSRASVELSFDNQQGQLSGVWRQYTDIAIKRVVTRQGDSTYWINHVPVRKKDVTDLFLGTGVGNGRSYAIIEQGMIAKIIEASPDELRVFLEEAAGVSRYQEKRKETEARLKDSQLNLDRLSDIVSELSVRHEALIEQAGRAQQYMNIEEDIRVTSLRLYAAQFFFAKNALTLAQEEQSLLVADLAKENAALEVMTAQVKEIEGAYYEAQKTLDAAQESLRYTCTTLVQQEKDRFYRLEKVKSNQGIVEECETEQQSLLNRLAYLEERERIFTELLRQGEESYSVAKNKVNAVLRELAEEEHRKKEIQTAIRDHRGVIQKTALDQQRLAIEIATLKKTLQEGCAQYESLLRETAALAFEEDAQIDEMTAFLLAAKQQKVGADQQLQEAILQEKQAQEEVRHARCVHQEAVQVAAQIEGKLALLSQEKKRLYDVIAEPQDGQSLAVSTTMTEWLDVHPDWRDALERVLSACLRAYGVSNFTALQSAAYLEKPRTHHAVFFDMAIGNEDVGLDWSHWSPWVRLRDNAPKAIGEILSIWLSPYYPMTEWHDIFVGRQQLRPGHYFVLPSGVCVGSHVVMVPGLTQEDSGFLHREAAWRALQEDKEQAEAAVRAAREVQEEKEKRFRFWGEEQQRARVQCAQWVEQIRTADHRLTAFRQQKQLVLVRRDEKIRERLSLVAAMADASLSLTERMRHLSLLSEGYYRHECLLSVLTGEFEKSEQAYVSAMSLRVEAEAQLTGLSARCRECTKDHGQVLSEKKRLLDRRRCVELRREKALADMQTLSGQSDHVDHLREEKIRWETVVAESQAKLLVLQEQKKQAEAHQMRLRQTILPMQERDRTLNLACQEKQFMIRKVEEELQKREMTLADLSPPVEQGGSIAFLKKTLSSLEKSLKQLGAVNLTAVEELRAVDERMHYLSAQITDLKLAMDTLRGVIQTIDEESSLLLKNMYHAVNIKLAEFFSVLFEGGEAYLEATHEDFLQARFQIIARPPGKKNKNIHLLSGGEKALTAIAFIFSMFDLNPAPFCLLDEVDAPLDDVNTIRLTRLLKKMSQKSQMIFISHNKITMDVADSLLGVTMPESGVSKVFDLDIQECLALIG